MRERDKVFAVLWFDGERQDTELTIEDCPPVNYPMLGRARGGQMEHDTRSCHFAPWEPGCSAGKVMPVDADHPANATLTWTWDNPEYRGLDDAKTDN
jgi:hypothetical protein